MSTNFKSGIGRENLCKFVANRASMTITLNGQQKEVPDGLTVLGLLQLLAIQPERVAVELNLDIVRKNAYSSTPVNDGDEVEVVSFMGGGSCCSK